MTFLTPASVRVSMFFIACSWYRYSLPRRRTGSPVQDSFGPRMPKLTPARCSMRGRGLGALAGPLVEGAGTADPVEVLDVVGDGAADDRDLEVERLDPVGPLGAAEAPRVALVLDVAEHEAGLGRELGLHQHLVAAHVDDGVDVLDVHRALLDAGAAGGARPQHVGVDDEACRRGPRPRRRRPGCAACIRSALANMLSRRSMMRSFGESGLPVFQAGHWDWQRPHSVQVAMSRSCFQEKSSMRPAPNTASSSSPTSSIVMSGVEARAPRARGRREVATLMGARKMWRCFE